jgi:hypothetical protein
MNKDKPQDDNRNRKGDRRQRDKRGYNDPYLVEEAKQIGLNF